MQWTEKKSETVLYRCVTPNSITHTFMDKRTCLANIVYVYWICQTTQHTINISKNTVCYLDYSTGAGPTPSQRDRQKTNILLGLKFASLQITTMFRNWVLYFKSSAQWNTTLSQHNKDRIYTIEVGTILEVLLCLIIKKIVNRSSLY